VVLVLAEGIHHGADLLWGSHKGDDRESLAFKKLGVVLGVDNLANFSML
jgi:hypothetical protein